MKSINQHLQNYLASRCDSGYTPKGVKTISDRLSKICKENLINGNPNHLMKFLVKNYKKNSIKCIFSDVISFYDYLLENGIFSEPNPYRAYRKKNKRNAMFSGSDEPKKVNLTYRQAWSKVSKIRNQAIRIRAFELLSTGLRFSDAQRAEGGNCIQKGGKSRPIYGLSPGVVISSFPYSYEYFRRVLKQETGLSPHDFRRLVPTYLYKEKKMHPIQIQKWLGHRDLNTTMRYVNAGELDEVVLSLGAIA